MVLGTGRYQDMVMSEDLATMWDIVIPENMPTGGLVHICDRVNLWA